MLKKIQFLINIGTGALTEKTARKTRIVNMMAVCAIFFPFIYAVFYFSIGEFVPMVINLLVIVLYGQTFLINHLKKREFAKVWIISIYMLHLFILTKFIFSTDTGFHYYYMALPPISFLIYDYHQAFEKISACVFPIALFVICSTIDFSSPFILLSATTNKYVHLSSIIFMFSGLIFIIFLFSSNIKQNEDDLEESIRELEKAVSEIKTLKGLIPICSTCKKIRDDEGYWNHLEAHIQKHSYAKFSHGICPDCSEKMYGKEDWYKEMKNKKGDKL